MIESSNLQASACNKNQSLFKLPIIFGLMMITTSLIYFIGDQIYKGIHFSVLTDWWPCYYFIYYMFIGQISNCVSFFFIAFIMLYKQKIHRITGKNILVLLLVCIGYYILNRVIMGVSSFLYGSIINELTPSEVRESFILVLNEIIFVFNLLILAGLFEVIALFGQREQKTYLLPYSNNRNLFAFIYAAILCLPLIMVSYWVINELWFYVFPLAFNSAYFSTIGAIFVAIIPELITAGIIFMSFVFYFFSTRGCFVRKFDKIPFKLIFKSAGWTYLYLLIFAIVISLVQYLIFMIVLFLVNKDYIEMQSMTELVLIISIVFCIMDLIGAFYLTRKAVRKYFSEQ